jgi:hypothetical protein
VGAVAFADPAADATRLFDEARALLKEGKYAEACTKFARSFELDRKPGTELNLGDCSEREGHLRRAWMQFDDAAREYDKIRQAADARLAKDPSNADAKRDSTVAVAGGKLARDRANAITPKLATVVVRVVDPKVAGLVLRIGDHSVAAAPEIIDHLDAGPVTIAANAPGREEFTNTVRADAGKQIVVDIPAMRATGNVEVAVVKQPPPGPEVLPPVDRGSKRQASRVYLSYGVGGGGVVLLAISGIIGLKVRADYNRLAADPGCSRETGHLVCTPELKKQIDDVASTADTATYVAIGGTLLVAGAVVIYFTAPRERVTIAPIASPNAAGVSVSGHF